MHEDDNQALRALELALIANTKIEQHEKTCAKRWSVVIKIGLIQITALLGVLGVLLQEKFM